MPTPIPLERRPLVVDPNDDDEVRRWLAQLVAEQVVTRREPVPAIHLLVGDHEEVLDLTQMLQADEGADLGATWALLTRRGDVDRCFLVLRLEHEDGTREAGIFEEVREDGEVTGWWFAHRAFDAENGIGRLLGSAWDHHAGTGPAPEPFSIILAHTPGGHAAQLLPARPPEALVWMQTGEVPAEVRLPRNANEMTLQTQSEVVGALEREGLKHLMVFLFRGRTWEKWLLGGTLPTTGDDMVRWICGRAGTPEMVATVEAVIAQVDSQPQRVARIVAEVGGQRVERALVLLPKPGVPADVVPGPSLARELGAVAEGDGWIGVEPLMAGELIATAIGNDPPR